MTKDFSALMQAWPNDAVQAIAMQKNLSDRARVENDFAKIDLIAGIDCSYDIKNNISGAYIVLMDRRDLKPLCSVTAFLPTVFPYIPGLLSFREIPVILDALKKLPQWPDLLMVDGQGVAHPRRLGIAAHLGVLTDMPSIGIAKSRLTGFSREPGPEKGDWEMLRYKGTRIGTVLRSRAKVKPLYISSGHRVDQDTALDLTLQCLRAHRLPEPTRIADKLSKVKALKSDLLL